MYARYKHCATMVPVCLTTNDMGDNNNNL